MAITSIGTPAGVHSATSAVTGSWGAGQDVTAGTLLVAVVAITTSAAATQAPTMTSGWALLASENNRGAAGTARANVFVYAKTSTAGDTAPTFTGTSGTTNSSYMMLLDLSGANTTTPLDISATYDSGTASSTVAGTATTAGTPAASGEYAISVFAQERATGTFTWSDSGTGDGTTDFSTLHGGNDGSGTSSTGQTYIGVLASPAAHTINDAGAFSTATTAYGAGLITVIALAPAPTPTAGPPLPPLQQPPGVRLIWLRTGNAQATLLHPAAVLPPVITPAPLHPLTQPARSRIAAPPRGRIYKSQGAPVRNPAAGPAFRLPRQPARTPVPAVFSKGRASGNKGAPVRNPTAGPVFRQATSPARARIPQAFSKGRTGALRGAPLANPTPGPALRPRTVPAQARRPLPPRGRTAGSKGAPVRNPALIPAPLYPLTSPVRARQPLAAPGRAATMGGLPVPVNPTAGPPFSLPDTPARARQPLPPKGRAAGSKGAPVSSPAAAGPKVYPLTQPVRARQSLPPRGRTTVTPAYVPPRNPGQGTQQQPLAYPAGVRVIFIRAGYGSGSKPGLVSNPVPALGPVFRQATQPAVARRLPARPGHVAGSQGAPVRNPAPPALVTVPPLRQPVRAKLPVPLLPGRAATMAMLPFPQAPSLGPAFRLPAQPVQARQPLPPRGRIAGSRGAPVNNPAVTPARFYPLDRALHGEPGVFTKGRGSGSAGAPVRNPAAGPARFYLAATALRAQPANFSKGRTSGNPGAPVRNPAPAPAYPLTRPVRSRITPAPHGRAYGSASSAVTPPPPAIPFRQSLNKATRAQPPVFLKGRIISSPGAPVRNPTRGPRVYPLHGPVRGQPAFPFLHGRAAGSGGAPVTFPPIPPSSAAGLLAITPAGRQAAIMSIRLATAATTDISQLVPAAVTASDPVPYHRPETITASPGTARIRPPGLVTLDPPGPLRT